MLKVGVIGVGNAGSQVALLAHKEGFGTVVLNSSENDLAMIPDDIYKVSLGDLKGAGKNRDEAKRFLKESVNAIVGSQQFTDMVCDKDVVFVVSSTGGGTGSGIVPLLTQLLTKTFPDTKVILVGILPTLKEAYSTQVNTVEFTQELYNKIENVTYMLYDNDKLRNTSSYKMIEAINKSIIDDIKVIACNYNYPTKYSSIDEKDMLMILNTPGRIIVASLTDFKEKDIDGTSIDEMLEKLIKSNTHAEMQRDKKIMRSGIIANLSESIAKDFDEHVTKLQEFIGEPVEEFTHVSINIERVQANNVFFIGSGLNPIYDRIKKINDRIEEIDEAQRIEEEGREYLEAVDVNDAKKKKNYINKSTDDKVVLSDIFKDFM